MNYLFHILVMLEIYVLLALGANQIIGFSGLLSLSQAVFFGVGAYTTGILSTKYGLGFWVSLPIMVLISIALSLVFSFLASRVRELYFGLATLCLQIIFFSVAYNWVALSSGPFGIAGIQSPEFFGYSINSPGTFAILGAFWVCLALIFYGLVRHSQLFRLIQATRDDQIAVLNLGKNPNHYKRISIGVAGILSGIAGALYASYSTYIDPSTFTLEESMLILSMVLIGGAGRVIGPVLGAGIYVFLPEILKFLQLPPDIAANMRMILFGLLLILTVLYKPQGILGKYQLK